MKFVCDNCKAKYQIADDKVAGKTVRMKCRRCGELIVIHANVTESSVARPAPQVPSSSGPGRSVLGSRPPPPRPPRAPAMEDEDSVETKIMSGPVAELVAAAQRDAADSAAGSTAAGSTAAGPASASPSSTGAAASAFQRALQKPESRNIAEAPTDDWYVGVDGVPLGPVRLTVIREKAEAGSVTPDSLVWREGYDEWQPLRNFPHLMEILEQARARRSSQSLPKARPSTEGIARPAPPAPRPAASTSLAASPSAPTPSRPSRPAPPAPRPTGLAAASGSPAPPRASSPGPSSLGGGRSADGPTPEPAAAKSDRGSLASLAAAAAARQSGAEIEDAASESVLGRPSAPGASDGAPQDKPNEGGAPLGVLSDPFAAPKADPFGAPKAETKTNGANGSHAPGAVKADDLFPPPAPASTAGPVAGGAEAAAIAGAATLGAPAPSTSTLASSGASNLPAAEAPMSGSPFAAGPDSMVGAGLPPKRRGLHPMAYAFIAMAAVFGGVSAYFLFYKPTEGPTVVYRDNPNAPEDGTSPAPGDTDASTGDGETPAADASGEPVDGGGPTPNGGGQLGMTGGQPTATGTETKKGDPIDSSSFDMGLDGPSADGPNGSGDGGAASQLSAGEVQGVVNKYKPIVRKRCWDPAYAARPPGSPSSAKVSASITVNPNGSVASANASGGGKHYPSLASCVAGQIQGWSFPPAGGQTKINVPFAFISQ